MALSRSKGQDVEKDKNTLQVPETFRRQGSLRIVLHPDEGSQAMLGVSAKILERTDKPNSDMMYDFQPYIQEYSLIAEFNMLRQNFFPGIYIIPSDKSPFLWFGVIFVRSGFYEGGIFRFNIHISEKFPDSTRPRVIFETKVFHPLIDEETMELNIKQFFPEWRKEIHHIWQIVECIYKSFCNVQSSVPTNIKAAELLLNDKEGFVRLVSVCVESSQIRILDTPINKDAHYLIFTNFDQSVHNAAWQSLRSIEKNDEEVEDKRRTLSWIKRDMLEPFSKKDE